MTKISMGGPKTRAIFEEVFLMRFNRAAPFLGPFSGPKKWTAAGFLAQFAAPTQPPSERLARPPVTSSSRACAQKFDQLADIIIIYCIKHGSPGVK